MLLGIDLLILLGVGVYFSGGIAWGAELLFSHGADLRRLVLLVGFLSFCFVPKWRVGSRISAATQWVVEQLKTTGGLSLFLGCFLALLLCVSVLQFLALRAPLWDIGLFHQILWNIKNGNGFESTVSGAGAFLRDHFSPTLALLVPLSWFLSALGVPEPLLLAIAHPLLLWGGVLAWVCLGVRASPSLGAAVCVFVLSFESLWKNLGWGFHENAIAFCASSWAFVLFFWSDIPVRFSRRAAAIVSLVLVTALSKEILLLNMALVFGCWAFWGSRKGGSKLSSPLFSGLIGASIALLVAFVLFEKMDHPADKNYFLRYYSYLGRDLPEFVRTLLLSPWVVVEQIGFLELLRYFWNVFSPWLFIPLWGPVVVWRLNLGPSRRQGIFWSAAMLFAALPSLASAALSTYFALRRPDYHYVLELWPALAVATIVLLSRIGSRKLIWAWALVSLLRWDYDPIHAIREFSSQARSVSALREVLQGVPAQASVMADDLAGPWIAGRRQVTRFPDRFFLPGACPDVFVVEEHLQLARATGPASPGSELLSCPAFRKAPFFRSGAWAIYTHSP